MPTYSLFCNMVLSAWELTGRPFRVLSPRRVISEVDVRGMLEKATGFEPNVVEGRFTIHVRHVQHSWIVIVEPDAEAKLLIVVTVYEVSND